MFLKLKVLLLILALMAAFSTFIIDNIHAQDSTIEISALDWSSDGEYLGVGYADGSVEIISISSGTRIQISPSEVTILAINWNPSDNTQIAFSGITGIVYVYDLDTNALILNFDSDADDGSYITWNASGTQLITASNDIPGGLSYQVRVWDAVTGALSNSFYEHTAYITDIENCPSNANLVASTGLDGYSIIWNIDTNELLYQLFNPQDGIAIAWSPDCETIATLSGDNRIRLWDTSTGEYTATIYEGTFLLDVVWSPNDSCLAVIDNEEVNIISLSGVELQTISLNYVANSIAWSIDDQFAYARYADELTYVNLDPIPTSISTATRIPSAAPKGHFTETR